MSYNEVKSRGTADFPMELYSLTRHSPKYNMAHHWHSELEIIRVISGELTVNINNSDICMFPGDVVFVNSEFVHGAVPDNCTYQCIVYNPEAFCFGFESMQNICDELLSHTLYISDYFPAESVIAQKTALLFEEMEKQDSDFSRLSCVAALWNLFGELQRSGKISTRRFSIDGSFNRNEQKLKKVLTFIRSNFDKKITLEQMSDVCGMSPKYFCSYFRKMTKMSPTEYLLFYRVEKSARMLCKSEFSVTDVAFSCGFSDLSYFIKVFKKQMGVPPGKYKKLYRQ